MTTAHPRTPRQPAEVRREQALDAALSLISSGGYRAVNMEAVARAMGTAKTVVYAAFPTLDALLAALLAREEERAWTALRSIAPGAPTGSPRELVEEWVHAGLTAVLAHPDAWCLMLQPPAGTPSAVRERLDRGRDFVLVQVRAALATLPRGPSDPELLAHAIVAVAEHGAQQALRDPVAFPPERFARFAGEVVEAALRDPVA